MSENEIRREGNIVYVECVNEKTAKGVETGIRKGLKAFFKFKKKKDKDDKKTK